jgi:hypothetical protein
MHVNHKCILETPHMAVLPMHAILKYRFASVDFPIRVLMSQKVLNCSVLCVLQIISLHQELRGCEVARARSLEENAILKRITDILSDAEADALMDEELLRLESGSAEALDDAVCR